MLARLDWHCAETFPLKQGEPVLDGRGIKARDEHVRRLSENGDNSVSGQAYYDSGRVEQHS